MRLGDKWDLFLQIRYLPPPAPTSALMHRLGLPPAKVDSLICFCVNSAEPSWHLWRSQENLISKLRGRIHIYRGAAAEYLWTSWQYKEWQKQALMAQLSGTNHGITFFLFFFHYKLKCDLICVESWDCWCLMSKFCPGLQMLFQLKPVPTNSKGYLGFAVCPKKWSVSSYIATS